MTSTLKGGGGGRGGLRQKWDVTGRRGVALYFFIKENWICAMTGHHAKPNINILVTRNLPFDSDVRLWRHPLMILLHFLWAKSSVWMSLDLVLFLFLNCSFTCMVRLLFHSLFTFSSWANKTGWLQNEY